MSKIPLLLLTTLLVLTTSAHAERFNDVFIGTIEIADGHATLTRCDLAKNQYELVDEPGQKDGPVQQFLRNIEHREGRTYGEVIGSYEEHGEGNRLVVAELQNLIPDKSCHLLDALEDLEKRRSQPRADRSN